MLLHINRKNKRTILRQIVEQLSALIDKGTLEPGAHLPSTRELAKTLGVNRSTVVKAYEELWAQGYLESRSGSYTTVRKRKPVISKPEANQGEPVGNSRLYRDCHNLKYDLMMHYIEHGTTLEAGKINFLQLFPDIRLLEKKKIKKSMREILSDPAGNPFGFAHSRGDKLLRKDIEKYMNLHNVHVEDKNILVTNGLLQSLQLIFQVFSKPGDYIVIEKPTYSIILNFIELFKLKIIEVPMTSDGMDLTQLRKVLKKYPVRFIYTMPTYQNPTGISLSQPKREELLQLCEKTDCIIIEDGMEEELNYYGKGYLPVKSIDHKGQVIYLGTFAKMLPPGLRIGWIIGTAECIKKLTVVKTIFEISSSAVTQMLLHKLFSNGFVELHLRKSRKAFRARMKVAVNAIKKYVPAGKIEWIEPKGGYMIWLKLLTRKIENIEHHFAAHGVVLHNGKYFFVKEQPCNYVRICIAQVNEAEIEEGIRRVGKAIRELE